jgi:uncharacterized membrane protein
MDEFLMLLVLIVGVAILSGIVLPIIALVISVRSKKRLADLISRLESAQSSLGAGALQQAPISAETPRSAAIRQLEARIEKLEAAMSAYPGAVPKAIYEPIKPAIEQKAERSAEPMPASEPPVEAQKPPHVAPESVLEAPRSAAFPASSSIRPVTTLQAQQLESIIGRRWLGWAAVILILFAAAFFLKYAFENRWIGELGRVAVGVAAGVSMTAFGFKYHKRGWRVFSQILTAGGIVLLYLSVYAAFGFYHLATQKTAFVYLAILVAEAAGLALLYEAPAIAIMALVGGFLSPILLRSDRDQYESLFGYIVGLDIGALALLKRWSGLSSLAFGGTHIMFWLWYSENYHPRKLGAVMVFQTAVFLIFLFAQVGRQMVTRASASLEDLVLLVINPFVFFGTAYHLLNSDYHDWMGVLAIVMALLYAGAAKILLKRLPTVQTQLLYIIAVALTFVTLAIPIQLRSNWITIGWAVEALAILWVGIETRAARLRALACTIFALALIRLVFNDTHIESRPMFTPVVNKYFLSALAVTASLFAAAALYQKLGERKQVSAPKLKLVILLIAIVTLWFVLSVETHTFFAAHAAVQRVAEEARHERWLGQMALSVLWSVYATALAAIGFSRRAAGVRWASLALFGLTVVKVMLVDIADLKQFYRIIAFFVLGVLLLAVAWGYQKAFHSKELSK